MQQRGQAPVKRAYSPCRNRNPSVRLRNPSGSWAMKSAGRATSARVNMMWATIEMRGVLQEIEGPPGDWQTLSVHLHHLEAAQSRGDDQILILGAVGNVVDGLQIGESQLAEHGDRLLRFTASPDNGGVISGGRLTLVVYYA